ncbi:uncharacterized protein LOC127527023 [Erpetoichthys calabaricus]|uniref:uncharacterized protein LOC127527023 n=1 Tax=Erpetoichthys calabaricus TaxID=27687 RepID=UPI0022340D0A|nr:uncharacterized protein LOC127527023 [Erpetoichthys calabaricus]
MPIINSFGPLEMYIDKEEGVALQADNGKYWSCISYDFDGQNMYIEAAKANKDYWCKFLVTKTSDGKVLLKDRRGMYLSRYDEGGIQYIRPEKSSPDEYCKFSVFTDDNKILLRADNGMYVSRIHREHQNIEAAKEGPDECCRFALSLGDVVEPSFKILSIEVKDFNPDQIKTPTAVAEQSYTNNTSVAQSHTFKLSWVQKTSETTTWNHAWGFSVSLSHEFKIVNFSATVSYNGSYEKSSTLEKTVTVADESTINVPPKSKVVAKLIVYKDDNAVVPFRAKIKKIDGNGVETILTEDGTWNGVFYNKVNINASEEPL